MQTLTAPTNLRADIEDILFEGRNKGYGAYDIRKRYTRHLTMSLLIAFAIAALAIGGPILYNYLAGIELNEEIAPPIIPDDFGPVDPPPLEDKPLPPPPEIPPPVKQIKFLPPVVERDPPVETPPPPIEDARDNNLGTKNVEGVDGPPPEGPTTPPPPPPPPPPTDSYAENVDEDPAFPGGYGAFVQFLKDNINYPEFCKENGIEGKVIVEIAVQKDGSIGDVRVQSTPHKLLSEEAIRIIKKSPKWTPAKVNGQAVKYRYAVPVKFTLTGR